MTALGRHRHIDSLDGLRGLAALVVVVRHTFRVFSSGLGPVSPSLASSVTISWLRTVVTVRADASLRADSFRIPIFLMLGSISGGRISGSLIVLSSLIIVGYNMKECSPIGVSAKVRLYLVGFNRNMAISRNSEPGRA